MRDANGELVSQDDYGKLWRLRVAGDEDLVMVELVNSTAEPDGTRKIYLERVPPTMRTAREAIAWQCGTDDDPLDPALFAVET